MKPGLAYTNSWKMMSNSSTTVGFELFDTNVQIDDAADVHYIQCKTSGNPLTISVIDNDRDKFNPIKAKQCRIEIVTEIGIDFSTFAHGPDSRWYLFVGNSAGDTLFKGYVVLADIQQNSLPSSQIIILTATDQLGLLKNIPLVNASDVNPTGKNKISSYIAWALRKTGLDLPIKVVNNIREENKPSGHFYNEVYLDAKTFESEIGECEDCYTVLEKILGESCFLTQYKGQWWIVNVDELDTNEIYLAHFTSAGVYTGLDAPTTYNMVVAKITVPGVFGHTADEIKQSQMQHGEVRLKYNYQTPLEVPCNIDFARGSVLDDSNPDRITYTLECWTTHRENFPSSGLIAATTDIYLVKENENNYEKKRYVVIEAVDPSSNLIMSEGIPVHAKDKFTVTMTRRLNSDVAGSGAYVDNGMQIRLIGDDGTYWTLQGETSSGDTLQWVASNSDFTSNNKYLWFEGNVSRDMTEPESLYGDTTSPPLPVDGTLYLLAHQTHVAAWNRDTYIEAVTFEYIPYINGSYRKYSGQHQRVYRTGGYLTKRENEVHISDSPKKLFKGAMFTLTSSVYTLTERFYAHNVFPGGLPADEFLHPYGEMQARSVWNQFRNACRIFTATLANVPVTGWPDLIHKYIYTDSDIEKMNRYFMLTGMEQYWKTGLMRSTIIEVFSIITGKVYDDPREFKYISGE